jgi:hypothetical protein
MYPYPCLPTAHYVYEKLTRARTREDLHGIEMCLVEIGVRTFGHRFLVKNLGNDLLVVSHTY